MDAINKPEITYVGKHESPHYATHQSAGFDLRAEIDKPFILAPMERAAIPTGVTCQLPASYEVQVRPRSGAAWLHGVTVLNAPGTVDPDFTGEVLVILINLGTQPYTIQPGDRIAQGVLARYEVIPELFTPSTKTRTGGFGSTGA